MDASFDLLPSALFSPSKAAQQRAQAQEWSHVESWLASRYQGRSVPEFERNEDTLKAFLGLVAANERADEERELLWNVQKDALAELKSTNDRTEDPISSTGLLNSLHNALTKDGRQKIQTLAEAAVTLDAPKATPESMLRTIVSQTQTSQTLSQTLLRATALQRRLENEIIVLRAQLGELRSPDFQAPVSLQRQTIEWARNTKQLRTKIAEYTERLGALESRDADLIEEVVRREKHAMELEAEALELECQLTAFRGLPKDRDEARREVERLRKELASLQRNRDEMFEGLVA